MLRFSLNGNRQEAGFLFFSRDLCPDPLRFLWCRKYLLARAVQPQRGQLQVRTLLSSAKGGSGV